MGVEPASNAMTASKAIIGSKAIAASNAMAASNIIGSKAITGSCERQRVEKGHLPRLSPEWYRGLAFVHWVLTTEHRRTGWLNRGFHHEWQLVLLHASSRYRLISPVYVIMPDHAHLVWIGLDSCGSDQRLAIAFLRKRLREALAPAEWQRQAYDNVLTESKRDRGAFQRAAQYIFENPVRKGIVAQWHEYPFLGCCLGGFPEFDVRSADYWERFWRCYSYLVEKHVS